jgi:hypothetical protein
MPPSVTLWRARLWPPQRTASSSPLSLASLGRTMTPGPRSMPP